MYKTFDELTSEALDYLVANSNITYTAEGSLSRALVGAMAKTVSESLDYGEYLVNQSFLDTATGSYLDRFGKLLGIARLAESNAFVTDSDQVIRFYVESGTLYQYLRINDSSGKIPKGTRIEDQAKSLTYVVSEDVFFDRTAVEVYVPAVCTTPGTEGNLGEGQLATHSLGSSEVKVTNDAEITTGRDEETDDDYRARLALAFSATGGNQASVALAIHGTPGLSDFRILNTARGAGTFDVLAIPETNKLARFVRESLETALGATVALGISFQVREPEYVPIAFTGRLIYPTGVEGAPNDIRNAERLILDYLGRIQMGGWLIIDQLIAAVLSNLENVQDIKLDELIIDSRLMPIADYKLPDDGIFIPDPALPIRIS